MVRIRQQEKFFLVLLGIGGLLMLFMLLPFLVPIVLAITFAVLFYPLYQTFLTWTKDNVALSTVATIVLIFVFVFTPLILLGFQIFQEATLLYTQYSNGGSFSDAIANIQQYVTKLFPFADIDINNLIRQAAAIIANNLGTVFSSAISTFIGLVLMVLLLYYLLSDSHHVYRAIVRISPLEEFHTREILDRLADVINTVVKGSLLVAFVQGVACTIGFSLFGMPEPLLWGTITGFAALIPPVGALFTIVPATFYLLSINNVSGAIGIFLWGTLGVALIDYLLRPLIIRRDIHVPPVFIIFSILGGISFFGPIGFLLGPLVLSFLLTLLEMYPDITHTNENNR